MDEVTVYDQSGKLLAVLDNADAVSYERSITTYGRAAFPCRRATRKTPTVRRTIWLSCRTAAGTRASTASLECPAQRKRQRAECGSTAWSM